MPLNIKLCAFKGGAFSIKQTFQLMNFLSYKNNDLFNLSKSN